MPIETINISFESTQNMQQYGNKITCTQVRKKMVIRNLIKKIFFFFWKGGGGGGVGGCLVLINFIVRVITVKPHIHK